MERVIEIVRREMGVVPIVRLTITPTRVTLKFSKDISPEMEEHLVIIAQKAEKQTRDVNESWRGIITNENRIVLFDAHRNNKLELKIS